MFVFYSATKSRQTNYWAMINHFSIEFMTFGARAFVLNRDHIVITTFGHTFYIVIRHRVS